MKARLSLELDSVAAGVVLLVAWKAVSGRPVRPKPINWKVPKYDFK